MRAAGSAQSPFSHRPLVPRKAQSPPRSRPSMDAASMAGEPQAANKTTRRPRLPACNFDEWRRLAPVSRQSADPSWRSFLGGPASRGDPTACETVGFRAARHGGGATPAGEGRRSPRPRLPLPSSPRLRATERSGYGIVGRIKWLRLLGVLVSLAHATGLAYVATTPWRGLTPAPGDASSTIDMRGVMIAMAFIAAAILLALGTRDGDPAR
jgi:hypothetical protein